MELRSNGVEHSITATYQHCYTALDVSSNHTVCCCCCFSTTTASTTAVTAATAVAKVLQAVVVLF
eukprot:4101-Heterococcus_DN1.PRE.1